MKNYNASTTPFVIYRILNVSKHNVRVLLIFEKGNINFP